MKKSILPLLLASAPVFAGEVAPMMAPSPCPCPCDTAQGWTVGIEVLGLKPYQSEGYYDGDLDAGLRGSIGFQFGDGMFIKLGGFGYDANPDFSDDNNSGQGDFDLTVGNVDLTVGQTFGQCGNFQLSPYVGLGWATFDEEWNYDGGYSYEYDFDGVGIVVGIDATRALANNFSLYGKFKQSIFFGETEDSYRGEGSGSETSDTLLLVSEAGLGIQYDFTFSNIAANVRAGVEGQWWYGPSDYDSESVGLGGFVLGANFRF